MTEEPDDVLTQVGRGIELVHQGARAAARELLTRLWEQVGAHGDPLHRCAIAHTLADAQDDVTSELTWDLRAADQLSDAHLDGTGIVGTPAGFRPSLHLNLADVYRRLGDHGWAQHHVRLGTAALQQLPDDGLRRMLREAFERVDEATR